MNQILSGVPVESLCLTLGILLSAKSYDTPIRIWQVLSNENIRLVDLSDVMFGLSDYLCSFRAGHFTPNVRPGQTQLKNLAGVNTAISIVYNQSKIKLFR